MDQYLSFPFLKDLEASWEEVLEELNNLLYNESENNKSYFKPWHEVAIYEGKWDVYGLYSDGKKLIDNCKRCPKTTALLDCVPRLINAGFFSMEPNTHIRPNSSGETGAWKCHLGLVSPEPLPNYDRRSSGPLIAKTCGLRVDNDFYYWTPGVAFTFDGSVENESWNWGNRTRFILAIDFKKQSSDLLANRLNRRSSLGDILALGMSAKG